MLTGLIPPTSGDAIINGFSVVDNMAKIRTSLGFCPQHDVLFPFLTAREHLVFFNGLKNVPPATAEADIDSSLRTLNLAPKASTLAGNLSGGMKRKVSAPLAPHLHLLCAHPRPQLCLAIAFTGDSRFVLLDEPTAGVDVASRRSVWDFIIKKREENDRSIMISTHFLDEAEVLADRVAIVDQGELVCCGSPLYLKNLYGVGYQLALETDTSADTAALKATVLEHVPSADVTSEVARELVRALSPPAWGEGVR
jgi:ABC-type multidrug transport system ATPase subunit